MRIHSYGDHPLYEPVQNYGYETWLMPKYFKKLQTVVNVCLRRFSMVWWQNTIPICGKSIKRRYIYTQTKVLQPTEHQNKRKRKHTWKFTTEKYIQLGYSFRCLLFCLKYCFYSIKRTNCLLIQKRKNSTFNYKLFCVVHIPDFTSKLYL